MEKYYYQFKISIFFISLILNATILLYAAMLTANKLVIALGIMLVFLVPSIIWIILSVMYTSVIKHIKVKVFKHRKKMISKAIKIAKRNHYYNMASRPESKSAIITTILKGFSKYHKLFEKLNPLNIVYNDDLKLQEQLSRYIDKYGNDNKNTILLQQEIWDFNHFNNIVKYLAVYPDKIDEPRPENKSS